MVRTELETNAAAFFDGTLLKKVPDGHRLKVFFAPARDREATVLAILNKNPFREEKVDVFSAQNGSWNGHVVSIDGDEIRFRIPDEYPKKNEHVVYMVGMMTIDPRSDEGAGLRNYNDIMVRFEKDRRAILAQRETVPAPRPGM